MPITTVRERLYARWKEADDAVRALINGAQSATVSDGNGSRSYTRANLSELRRERASLAKRIGRLDRGGRHKIQRIGVRFDG